MKHLTHTLKTLLLSLCCLYVLSSCQKDEEIIPLTDADHVGEVTADAFAIEDAVNIVVDENGEITGYLDDKLNFRDINGDHLPQTESLNLKTNRVVIYEGTDFTGRHRAVFSSGNIVSHFFANADFTVRSIAVPPGCTVQLFKNNDLTGSVGTFGWNSDTKADYQRNISAFTTEGTKSLTVTCHEGREIYTQNTFCGYSYSQDGFVGNGFPIYKSATVDLLDLGQSAYSFQANTSSTCPGTMFYSEGNTRGVPTKTEWVASSQSNSSLSGSLGGTPAAVVIPTSEYAIHFDDIDFPVGAVLYENQDYSGKPVILSKGFNTRFGYSNPSNPIADKKSIVVAPGCRVYFGASETNNNDAIDFTNGAFQSQATDYPDFYAYVECDDFQSNDYCGVVTSDDDPLPLPSNLNQLPVFNGVADYSTAYGTDYLQISDKNVQFSNGVTAFYPYSLSTNCQGVTLWDDLTKGDEGEVLWTPTGDGTSVILVETDPFTSSPKSISTEGCNNAHTGMNLEYQIQMATLLNNLFSAEITEDRSLAGRLNKKRIVTALLTVLTSGSAAFLTSWITDHNKLVGATLLLTGTVLNPFSPFCAINYNKYSRWNDKRYVELGLTLQPKDPYIGSTTVPTALIIARRVFTAAHGYAHMGSKVKEHMDGLYTTVEVMVKEYWGKVIPLAPYDDVHFMEVTDLTTSTKTLMTFAEADATLPGAVPGHYENWVVNGDLPPTGIEIPYSNEYAYEILATGLTAFKEWAPKNRKKHKHVSSLVYAETILGNIPNGLAVSGIGSLYEASMGNAIPTSAANTTTFEEFNAKLANGDLEIPQENQTNN